MLVESRPTALSKSESVLRVLEAYEEAEATRSPDVTPGFLLCAACHRVALGLTDPPAAVDGVLPASKHAPSRPFLR